MSGASQNGRFVVRSAILIFLVILAFATTPARAQGTWLETRITRAICSGELTPVANTDRLARRLNLTDPQKAALKDMIDASASADASAKKSLCADRPDLSTAPGRMAFAEKMAETRLAGLKAVEPKLQGQPGREAEESVRHWRAHRRHIRLVGQEIKADWESDGVGYGRNEFCPCAVPIISEPPRTTAVVTMHPNRRSRTCQRWVTSERGRSC
jgi:LTXXQ motif family protein